MRDLELHLRTQFGVPRLSCLRMRVFLPHLLRAPRHERGLHPEPPSPRSLSLNHIPRSPPTTVSSTREMGTLRSFASGGSGLRGLRGSGLSWSSSTSRVVDKESLDVQRGEMLGARRVGGGRGDDFQPCAPGGGRFASQAPGRSHYGPGPRGRGVLQFGGPHFESEPCFGPYHSTSTADFAFPTFEQMARH